MRYSPQRKMRPDAVSRQTVPLPGPCQAGQERLYKKGTPVPALTETGAGAARYSAPHGCQLEFYQQPRPIATMGRGALLSGVRRQQQHHSQGDKRDHDQTSHGRAFSGLRRAERRQSSERKQPCSCLVTCLFPARKNAEGQRVSPSRAGRLFSIAKGPNGTRASADRMVKGSINGGNLP